MAGEDAVNGPKIVDSSRFSIAQFVEWQHAKYGKLSVHDFAKMHLIHTPQGKVCAAMVTPGQANDSPYLRKMIEVMPEGSGDMLGDAAYGGVKNCNAIRDSGRRAVIDVKSNATPKGLNARAEMLRFREEHPRTFHSILRIRNNVKERLLLNEGEVRRGGPGPQAAHPGRRAAVNVCICYHMIT